MPRTDRAYKGLKHRKTYSINPVRSIEERNKLIEENIDLAYRFVGSKIKKNRNILAVYSYDDMVSDAMFGLGCAAELYDSDLSNFSTYAYNWMRQAIQRGIMRNKLIRTPCRYNVETRDHFPIVEYCPIALENKEMSDADQTLSLSVQEAIGKLHSRYRDIVTKRMNGLSLEDIGKEYGVTKERIRQLEVKAHRELFRYLWHLQEG